MLPVLGSTFWQSMKNKVRKAKQGASTTTTTESVVAEHDGSGRRLWDLRILLEHEPRLWAACFRTPQSFVALANSVTSRYVFCSIAFSDNTWHESNHHSHPSLDQSSIDTILTLLLTLQVRRTPAHRYRDTGHF